MKLKVMLPMLALMLFFSSDAFGALARYVKIHKDLADTETRFHLGELEAFSKDVIPNELGGGTFGGLTTSTNDETAVGFLASETTSGSGGSLNNQHGNPNGVFDNDMESGGAVWSTRPGLADPDPQYTLDLGAEFDITLVRGWGRADGCCQERWRGLTVELFRDGGGGTLGAMTASALVVDGQSNTPFSQAFAAHPVPEPATAALLGAGLIGLLGRRKRQVA